MNVFSHSGDLGDVIAALPAIREMGGGDIVLCPSSGKDQGRESLHGARYEAIKPLLLAQPYIHDVRWEKDPKNVTHDMRGFRVNYQLGESLLDWQARFLGIEASDAPWLTAVRSSVSIGRTVIARSLRYHNPGFPWHVILNKHRNVLFVGTEEEHKAFQVFAGRPIDYHPTKNLLELAEIIGGSHLFVGNQSCPFWIAAGLGVNLIQESWPHSPNSQIRRPNARYMIRGPFSL